MSSSAKYATASWDATDKQVEFIHKLEAERGLPLTTATLRRAEASLLIDELLDKPKTVDPTIAAAVVALAAPQAADAEAEAQFESESIGREEAEPFAALGEPDKLVGKRVTITGSVYAIVATNTGTGLATLQRVSGKPHPLLGERGRIERSIAKGLIA